MQKNTLIFFFCLACVFILNDYSSSAQTIPTSSRSERAISRVKPGIEASLSNKNLQWGSNIYIRIFKSERLLEVWVKNNSHFVLFKVYIIYSYGAGTLGPKLMEGDQQAPEGFYFVTPGQLNPNSQFHLAFNIGYPNLYDRFRGRTGSFIMVHGSFASAGCFAMTDPHIEEIYALIDAAFRGGQHFFRLHIFPFKMTEENMHLNRESHWYTFWLNLKQGYDFFYENGYLPPNVQLVNGEYAFRSTNR